MYPTTHFRTVTGAVQKLQQWWTNQQCARDMTPPEQCQEGEWRDVKNVPEGSGILPASLAAAAKLHKPETPKAVEAPTPETPKAQEQHVVESGGKTAHAKTVTTVKK